MKKKLTPYIIVIAILTLIITIAQFLPAGKVRIIDLLKFDNKYSSQGLRDFHVRDTAAVTKIFLVDKNNRSITLNRKGSHWVVNGSLPSRYDAVELLLKTIYDMRVKMPVAMSAQEQILKNMAGRSIKVEIYAGKEKAKVFYVGGVTQDNLGSYMLLENSDVPYIVEIPGFRGFLSSRFSTDIINWRSNVLISEAAESIKEIEILIHSNPTGSFKVIQTKPQEYELYNYKQQKAKSFDALLIKGFFEQFEIAHFNMFVNLLDDNVRDSVLQTPPVYTIKLTDKNDSIQNYNFYSIRQITIEEDPDTELYPQSMWAFNNIGDWVIIQTYPFLLMFRQFGDFKPQI